MADNVTLDLMSGGDEIAADDISGVKFQRIKLVHGDDGVNDGDVSSANPFPTSLNAIYKSTPDTKTDGQVSNIVTDENENIKVTEATGKSGESPANDTQGVTQKPIVSSAYSGQGFSNFGAATNANVSSVPALIKSITCSNISASLVYIQIFNLAVAPTEDSSVPLFSFAVPAGSSTVPGVRNIGAEFFGDNGLYLSGGLSWGVSASPGVFDAAALTATNYQVNGVVV